MSQMGQVHWHEGLFLQPHHLQVAGRESGEALVRERRLGWAYPYGVVECRISTDSLENMLVRIDRLRCVMPSGLEVDVPGNTDIPALDIKRVFQAGSGSFTVSLAVPVWHPTRGNTVEPQLSGQATAARRALAEETRIKRLYRVMEVSRADENTGENAQPVMLRRINARLVTDDDDTSDMEVIPLVRITHAAEEQTMPRQDPKFVPPCMVLGANATLRNLVRDLANSVESTRKELVNQMTRGGFVVENLRGPQVMQLMRLQTLNRYASRLTTMINAGVAGPGSLAPLDAYMEIRDLLSELAALSPDRDPYEAPKYDHDNPGPVFVELDRKVRPLLRGDVQKRFLQVPLVKEGLGLAAVLTEEHVTQPNAWYLGVRTRMDPSKLAALIEDQDKFKVMPKSMGKLNIFGVKLTEDRHPPLELPSSADLHYFRLQVGESAKMWERITGEKGLFVRWPEHEPLEYTDVQLYMTVP